MSNATNQQARRLPLLHINADERHALDTFGEWAPAMARACMERNHLNFDHIERINNRDTTPAQIVAVEHVSADTDAVTGEDTRGECWTWYTDAGDYSTGDRVQLTFDGTAVIDATPAG